MAVACARSSYFVFRYVKFYLKDSDEEMPLYKE